MFVVEFVIDLQFNSQNKTKIVANKNVQRVGQQQNRGDKQSMVHYRYLGFYLIPIVTLSDVIGIFPSFAKITMRLQKAHHLNSIKEN